MNPARAAIAFILLGATSIAQVRLQRYQSHVIQFAGFSAQSMNNSGDVVSQTHLCRIGQTPVDIAVAAGVASPILGDVTNTGVVVGNHRAPFGSSYRFELFRWDPSTGVTESHALPGVGLLQAVCASDDGWEATLGSGSRNLFIRDPLGTWTTVVPPTPASGNARFDIVGTRAMTDQREFLCDYYNFTHRTYEPALVSTNGVTLLGFPPGLSSCQPWDSNRQGEVLAFAGSSTAAWRQVGGQWQPMPAPYSWLAVDDDGRYYGSILGVSPRETVVHANDQIIRFAALLDGPNASLPDGSLNLVSDGGAMYFLGGNFISTTHTVCVPAGPCLALHIDPQVGTGHPTVPTVATGSTMSLTILGGLPGELCAIFLGDGAGGVIAPPVFLGLFDQDGKAMFSAVIPASFANTSLEFKAAALDSQFGILDAPTRTVQFQ